LREAKEKSVIRSLSIFLSRKGLPDVDARAQMGQFRERKLFSNDFVIISFKKKVAINYSYFEI